MATREAADTLDAELTEPFTLTFMRETEADGADTVVEGHGGFSYTGVEAQHIKWLTPQEEPDMPGKGRILLEFTDEGFALMKTVLEETRGKNLGLFVRGHLAAKLAVDREELRNIIVIAELPSVEIAHVFADDVNAGIHVTLEPRS